MIQVAIVEDDNTSRDLLLQYISRYEKEYEEKLKISTFADGADIVENYQAVYDIIFLDIQMSCIDGMRTAEIIRTFDSDVLLIFITNMAQYAIRGYTVQAMYYLLKPVPYFAFSQCLHKAVNQTKERKDFYLTIKIESGLLRININHIYYLESQKHQIYLYTKDGTYTTRATMKYFEAQLSKLHFYRCSNSYLVHLKYVKGIVQNDVLIGDERLQISRARKKAFMDALTDYVGGVK